MPRILAMTYGDRVRRARLDTGLTQEEFAEEVGSTQGIVGHHEKMDIPPQRNRKALALMIEHRYDVSADWLLSGDRAQVTAQSLWALAA